MLRIGLMLQPGDENGERGAILVVMLLILTFHNFQNLPADFHGRCLQPRSSQVRHRN